VRLVDLVGVDRTCRLGQEELGFDFSSNLVLVGFRTGLLWTDGVLVRTIQIGIG
jgi:hypothetical protein